GERVRTYLLAHPEVLREVARKLDEKDAAAAQAHKVAEVAKIQAKLPQFRAAIEHDPRDFVANPGGKITLTQFYDYHCPYCKSIAPSIVEIIRSNPDVRVVFKEAVIFGPKSEHAAAAALAVKASGGDYLGFYEAMMKADAKTDADVDALALAHGATAANLKSPQLAQASRQQILDTQNLFRNIGLEGTPGYVIGDTVIPGAYLQDLSIAIAEARGRRPLAQ
ncbi:MAG TPA: DsbA family protein, partial [Caulobacteraceae bacterium]|nr:DsbA family protein [Caulobacteraceae bacterium]